MSKPTIVVTSWLEEEHIAHLRNAFSDEVEVLYDPSLLAPPRYIADHDGQADFQRTPEHEARWAEMLVSADICFDLPYRDRHPHTYAPSLKWIQTTSAGVGQTAHRLGIGMKDGITITTASGVHARPLAEFVFMVLLMASKNYPLLQQQRAEQRWERHCSTELTGKTLAIIGPGRIGREVARIARTFDMHPVALSRDTSPGRAEQLGVDRIYDREHMLEMIASADAIVISAPHTPETENIMDRAAFDALKPGGVLINIGRGQLVDEAAMLEKLQDGTIAFAGLDVFRTEPLPPDSPFWQLPNVVVSPHSASTTAWENGRIMDIFTHNLRAWLDGTPEAMRNVLDVERMY